jgi:hypothetical protein
MFERKIDVFSEKYEKVDDGDKDQDFGGQVAGQKTTG